MKFVLRGIAKFDAENLDDAFMKLSEHFRKLSNGEDSDLMEAETDLSLVRDKEGEQK